MKPSERIYEILKEKHGGSIIYLAVAIIDYLDEEYEKKHDIRCVIENKLNEQ